MIIQEARSDKYLIGWRINVGLNVYLVWKDQKNMPGVRVAGDHLGFVPELNEVIDYKTVYECI